jgi:hypothetical protein
MSIDDTHPDALRVQADVLSRLSGTERLAAVDALTTFVHSLATAGLRERFPEASPLEIERAHYELVLGRDLARLVLAYRDSLRATRESAA